MAVQNSSVSATPPGTWASDTIDNVKTKETINFDKPKIRPAVHSMHTAFADSMHSKTPAQLLRAARQLKKKAAKTKEKEELKLLRAQVANMQNVDVTLESVEVPEIVEFPEIPFMVASSSVGVPKIENISKVEEVPGSGYFFNYDELDLALEQSLKIQGDSHDLGEDMHNFEKVLKALLMNILHRSRGWQPITEDFAVLVAVSVAKRYLTRSWCLRERVVDVEELADFDDKMALDIADSLPSIYSEMLLMSSEMLRHSDTD